MLKKCNGISEYSFMWKMTLNIIITWICYLADAELTALTLDQNQGTIENENDE